MALLPFESLKASIPSVELVLKSVLSIQKHKIQGKTKWFKFQTVQVLYEESKVSQIAQRLLGANWLRGAFEDLKAP